MAAEQNQVVFKVRTDATKSEIKQAVELLFEVEVSMNVTVMNYAASNKRLRDDPWSPPELEESLRQAGGGSSTIDFLGGENKADLTMSLHKSKPTSAGTPIPGPVKTPGLHKGKPHEALVDKKTKSGGRNNNGRITVRHHGGGHKQRYRIIDFKRDKDGVPACRERLEYDPNRSAHIALIKYADGERRYILAPKGIGEGRRS